jgi:hypothetical protein
VTIWGQVLAENVQLTAKKVIGVESRFMRNSTSWRGWSLTVQMSSLAAATNYTMQRAKKNAELFSHALRYQTGRNYLLVVVAFFFSDCSALPLFCEAHRRLSGNGFSFGRIGSSVNTTVILMVLYSAKSAARSPSVWVDGSSMGFCRGYCILGHTDCKRGVRDFSQHRALSVRSRDGIRLMVTYSHLFGAWKKHFWGILRALTLLVTDKPDTWVFTYWLPAAQVWRLAPVFARR